MTEARLVEKGEKERDGDGGEEEIWTMKSRTDGTGTERGRVGEYEEGREEERGGVQGGNRKKGEGCKRNRKTRGDGEVKVRERRKGREVWT